MKAALLGEVNPDDWDQLRKPKGRRWATYERSVAKYDAAEEMLDAQLVMAVARLMNRIQPRRPDRSTKALYFMPARLGEYFR